MKLILFRGRPGSGKTTISNELSKIKNIPILRKDDIYDVASEFVTEHSVRNKISYNSLYAILKSNAHTECEFILDYPFQTIEDLKIVTDWCNQNEVKLQSILVTCSDENEWAKRFNVRSEKPSPNQLLTNFEDMKKHYGEMQLTPMEGELFIDSIYELQSNITKILDFIK